MGVRRFHPENREIDEDFQKHTPSPELLANLK